MIFLGVLLMISALIFSFVIGYKNKTKAKVTVKWGVKDPMYAFKLFGVKPLIILVLFWTGFIVVIVNVL